jgi:hypothetical protein
MGIPCLSLGVVTVSVSFGHPRVNRNVCRVDGLAEVRHDGGRDVARDLVGRCVATRHDADVVDAAVAVADAGVSDADEGADE